MHRRQKDSFIEISKFKLYLWLHAIALGLVLTWQSFWLFSEKTMASCTVSLVGPEQQRQNSGTLIYAYTANGKMYSDYSTRNEIPITQDKVEIRYLRFWPIVSRLNSFEGNWLGFIIAYSIFFTVTTMIFFIPNDTMPRHSYFYFTRRKPFIHMIVK